MTHLHVQPPLQVVVGWQPVGQQAEGAAYLAPVLLVQLQTERTQPRAGSRSGSPAPHSPAEGPEQPLHPGLKSARSPGSPPLKADKHTRLKSQEQQLQQAEVENSVQQLLLLPAKTAAATSCISHLSDNPRPCDLEERQSAVQVPG